MTYRCYQGTNYSMGIITSSINFTGKYVNTSKNFFQVFRSRQMKNNYFFLSGDLHKSTYDIYLLKCVTLEMKSTVTNFNSKF